MAEKKNHFKKNHLKEDKNEVKSSETSVKSKKNNKKEKKEKSEFSQSDNFFQNVDVVQLEKLPVALHTKQRRDKSCSFFFEITGMENQVLQRRNPQKTASKR